MIKPSSSSDAKSASVKARVCSVASSLIRCAIVIESVLKMTKAQTKNDIPAKAKRNARIGSNGFLTVF